MPEMLLQNIPLRLFRKTPDFCGFNYKAVEAKRSGLGVQTGEQRRRTGVNGVCLEFTVWCSEASLGIQTLQTWVGHRREGGTGTQRAKRGQRAPHAGPLPPGAPANPQWRVRTREQQEGQTDMGGGLMLSQCHCSAA